MIVTFAPALHYLEENRGAQVVQVAPFDMNANGFWCSLHKPRTHIIEIIGGE